MRKCCNLHDYARLNRDLYDEDELPEMKDDDVLLVVHKEVADLEQVIWRLKSDTDFHLSSNPRSETMIRAAFTAERRKRELVMGIYRTEALRGVGRGFSLFVLAGVSVIAAILIVSNERMQEAPGLFVGVASVMLTEGIAAIVVGARDLKRAKEFATRARVHEARMRELDSLSDGLNVVERYAESHKREFDFELNGEPRVPSHAALYDP